MGPIGGIELLIIAMLSVLIFVWPAWRILSKAGYPGWFGVGALFPPVLFVLALFMATAEWPIERELRQLKSQQARE